MKYVFIMLNTSYDVRGSQLQFWANARCSRWCLILCRYGKLKWIISFTYSLYHQWKDNSLLFYVIFTIKLIVNLMEETYGPCGQSPAWKVVAVFGCHQVQGERHMLWRSKVTPLLKLQINGICDSNSMRDFDSVLLKLLILKMLVLSLLRNTRGVQSMGWN